MENILSRKGAGGHDSRRINTLVRVSQLDDSSVHLRKPVISFFESGRHSSK